MGDIALDDIRIYGSGCFGKSLDEVDIVIEYINLYSPSSLCIQYMYRCCVLPIHVTIELLLLQMVANFTATVTINDTIHKYIRPFIPVHSIFIQ